ncbi:MAG TPA: hypothetical protein VGX68_01780 [Thermoanaerobaculia bacterium]|jgi:hypothetical protein|nr:hypothetical protein [Thermoanaerobaculia bacterium]
MTEFIVDSLRSTTERILTAPVPEDVWHLQKDLLALGGEAARQAREVAGAFHSCLRNMQSKTASRSASRRGAALGSAAVASVSLQEMFAAQEDPLKGLLASGLTAMLEVGSAFESAQAWEVEASLMYYDLAWYLYGELWEISLTARPELSPAQRRARTDLLLKPVMDPETADATKAALLVRLFQVVLAARMWPLLKA